MQSLGIRSGAAGTTFLSGRVWGAVAAVWSDAAEMPVGAEDRVAAFAGCVAYAIENAEARDEIAASRARLVEAADEARRGSSAISTTGRSSTWWQPPSS